MNIYFEGSWRMDWGLGNPNKTAVLIALIMLFVWAIAFVWKKGFWVALAVTVGLAWCLVQTYSRGGMLAALVGFGILIATASRPWPRPRWIAVLVAFWILAGFILYSKAQLRYEQGLFTEDQGIGHRLIIWKHVPEMMWSAPWGWGLGKAGDAYTEWYQPLDQPYNYLNLLNSHFTWMVELGWLGALLYVFGWLLVLQVSIPSSATHLGWLPLSVWIALAVGSCFSAVAETAWLWLVPSLSLVYSLGDRLFRKKWPSLFFMMMNGATSLLTIAILLLVGCLTTKLPIQASGNVSVLGGNQRIIVFVDRHVVGPLFGHTFRSHFAELSNRTWVFVAPGNQAPEVAKDDEVWVFGKLTWPVDEFHKAFASCNRILLVNPDFSPDDLNITSAETQKTKVLFGEYCQMPSRSAWTGFKELQIDGAGDFIPDWPTSVLDRQK